MKAQPASALVVVVVPLLFQTGFEAYCDRVVSVVAPRTQRIERVMRRDGVSGAQVEERMSAQLSDEEYEKRADLVIHNDGDIAELERASDKVWADLALLRSADQKPPDVSN